MDFIAGVGLICALITAAVVLRRTGYSVGWALLVLVPVVNLIALIVFLLSSWPIERELACARVELGRAKDNDYWLALDAARDAERAGDCARAIELYQRIARSGEDRPWAIEAEQRLADASERLPDDAAAALPGDQPSA